MAPIRGRQQPPSIDSRSSLLMPTSPALPPMVARTPSLIVIVNETIDRDDAPLLSSKSEPRSPLVIGIPIELGLKPAAKAAAACVPLDACGLTGWFGYETTQADPDAGHGEGSALCGLRKHALQLVILIAVMLQNAGYALLRAYSRGVLKETYSTSSVLLAMELIKLVFC